MLPESRKYLHDILGACDALLEFVKGKSFDDYDNQLLLRSAVERQLMIIGEALNQAVHEDQDISDSIENVRDIINLRNVIVHG